MVSLRSALNSWTTPRVASSVTSRVQVCDLCFAIEFQNSTLSLHSPIMAVDFLPPRDIGNFRNTRLYGNGERKTKTNGVFVCGWKWRWNGCRRPTYEIRTRTNKPTSNRSIFDKLGKRQYLRRKIVEIAIHENMKKWSLCKKIG